MTELAANYEQRHKRIALLLGSGGPVTPDSVRRLKAQPSRAGLRARHTLRLRLAWASAGVVTATSVAVAVGSSGPGGVPPELNAGRVAYEWKLPVTSRDVAPALGDHSKLAVSFHGTAYPNYHDDEGWHAVGTRSDRLAGHSTFTVFYATGARRSAYTVVAGTTVSVPQRARWTVMRGLRLTEFRSRNRWIVVFRDHGNSCVLTAAAPRERLWLLKLAVWETTTKA
jgi:hypothetical protein